MMTKIMKNLDNPNYQETRADYHINPLDPTVYWVLLQISTECRISILSTKPSTVYSSVWKLTKHFIWR